MLGGACMARRDWFLHDPFSCTGICNKGLRRTPCMPLAIPCQRELSLCFVITGRDPQGEGVGSLVRGIQGPQQIILYGAIFEALQYV